MENIRIKEYQLIELESVDGSTVAKAVNEAIQFCIENNQVECVLNFNGFQFDIEPTTDIREKVSEYWQWANNKKQE